MATKSIAAKTWSLQPSFDGLRYSGFPSGDKPAGYQSIPTLLNTDIVSGSLTGGENNKGAYMSLFGYGFGTQANLGLAAGARVYMRDPLGDNAWHQVDNYRALLKSRVFDKLQIQQLIVQVGSLGGSITNGRALDVKVTINGVDTNIVTGGFTVQPGDFWFVSLNGDDSTGVKNDIAHPFRYLQKCTVVAGANTGFTGIWATGNLKAGDTLVLRDTGLAWTDSTGYEGRWCRFFKGGAFQSATGSAPTGTAGTGTIHFTRYPGPIGGNTPEDVRYITQAEGNATVGRSGGIQGASSDGALKGWGQYVTVSGLRISGVAYGSADGGFVDFQNSGVKWRVTDCELGPWVSGDTDYRDSASGGVGDRAFSGFNYIHDIEGKITALQTHGIYFGGVEGGTGFVSGSRFNEIAYNWIKNCPGGSSIQFNLNPANNYLSQNISGVANNGSGLIRITVPTMNDSARGNDGVYNVPAGGVMPTNAWVLIDGVVGATQANGIWKITYVDSTHFDLQGSVFSSAYVSGGHMQDVSVCHFGNLVHDNFIDGCAKFNINFAPGSIEGKAWNNVCLNAGLYAIRIQPTNTTAPQINITISHNTIYNPKRTATEMECNLTTGSLLYRHNIFVYGPDTQTDTGGYRFDYNGGGADPNSITVYDRNLYFDTRTVGQITTKYSGDTNGSWADPLFTDIAAQNFTVQTGSPALNAATSTESIPVIRDIFGIVRSVTTPTIGATEGVGT